MLCRRLVRALVPTALVLAAATGASSDASVRHARLLRSFPPNDTTLATAPRTITLWFSRPVQPRLSRLHLQRAEAVAARGSAGPSVGGVELTLPRSPSGADTVLVADVSGVLSPGTYDLLWSATSRDSHAIKGTIRFRVIAGGGATRN